MFCRSAAMWSLVVGVVLMVVGYMFILIDCSTIVEVSQAMCSCASVC